MRRVLEKVQREGIELRRQTILAWLNTPLPNQLCTKLGQQRIRELIEGLTHLGREWRKGGSKNEMNLWATRVNDHLSRYPSRKMVWWDPENGFDFANDFGALKGAKSLEANAAYFAVELAEKNALDGLRECICGKWFFARQHDQKSCSTVCRHKRYERTDEFRAIRREYMKNYYRRQMKDYRKPKRVSVK